MKVNHKFTPFHFINSSNEFAVTILECELSRYCHIDSIDFDMQISGMMEYLVVNKGYQSRKIFL